MASILPGYEYDIFISYRHNDNKRDGWVTEFVRALRDELDTTLKNEVNIYFDENPLDGLLETHDVDKSLEKKLKCLVFIPIISQTYCDESCYAWRHEFLPFVEMARDDELRLNITLRNGNVTSRVLPVQIHELDQQDQQLIESALGNTMRSIPFIFKSKGVNRPLGIKEDHPHDNLNKTFYKDQINKLANILKEIIYTASGVKAPSNDNIFTEITKEANYESIAVLPFVNMSNDPEQDYFGDGIAEEIINTLVQIPELKVTGRTSSFSFKTGNLDLREIGEKLSANKILEGSVRKSGDRIRITAQLIEAKSGFHIWSEKFDEKWGDIFTIQDNIAETILKKLKIDSKQKIKTVYEKRHTEDPEILNQYLLAKFYFNKRTPEGFEKSLQLLEGIIQKEPLFAPAYATVSDCYRLNLLGYGVIPRDEALTKLKEYSAKALEIDPNQDAVHASLGHTALLIEWNFKKCDYHLSTALKINPNNLEALQWYGWYYLFTEEFETASKYFNKALKIDPLSVVLITESGWPYNYAGNLVKAQEYYEKAIEIDPNYALAYFDLGNVLINQGEINIGIKTMEKAIEMWGNVSFFIGTIGYFYAKLGNKEKADACLKMLLEQHGQGVSVAFNIADVYEGMQDVKNTLKWLSKAKDQKELMVPGAKLWRRGHLQSDLLLDNDDFNKLMSEIRNSELE